MMPDLPSAIFGDIVGSLALAVFVFRHNRVIYGNAAAETLGRRLRASYRIELEVMLCDHLRGFFDHADTPRNVAHPAATVTLLTATNGEPFHIHVMPLVAIGGGYIAVSVRAIGSEIDAFRRRYNLSEREAQVAELVLHGYKNIDIASALGIAPATIKKHLTRIFDKVGVDTRSQLQSRLA